MRISRINQKNEPYLCNGYRMHFCFMSKNDGTNLLNSSTLSYKGVL